MTTDLPADYEHCVTIFDAMAQVSVPSAAGTKLEGLEDYRVYEGYLTKLFREHNLSIPYYTKIMRLLQRMDCVRQVRRGGGSAKSKWLLVQPPNPKLWGMIMSSASTFTGVPKADALLQMVKALNERVSALEQKVGIAK